jgi:triphosphoribosyl-dephospho-CoA synthase
MGGFPHAVRVALPALRRARAAGQAEIHARLDALLSVMEVMNDTCLLHRGGLPALRDAQSGARAVRLAGGSGTPEGWAELDRLHLTLMAHNASPGGAADMLAAALFLDRIAVPLRPVPVP